ncbi:hypothetical protein CYMTET_26919 [Cymbomonas tetramitiformis]|uniref:Uncharacterized protein n=1 Tax=Cymbomonas tetramitiformis TaxID=36881 RepID=A0AAE0FR49_9CHLO|nr:hypothetical protein CYMTET_26919 [Cymbomonas tetramitiformis]
MDVEAACIDSERDAELYVKPGRLRCQRPPGEVLELAREAVRPASLPAAPSPGEVLELAREAARPASLPAAARGGTGAGTGGSQAGFVASGLQGRRTRAGVFICTVTFQCQL